MNIDNILILSAGLGTRMGQIGESLPKPLWPVFNAPLLLAQIKIWERFNPKRIFINTHHCSNLITNYIRSLNNSKIVLLNEEILLGSGGPFFSVKKYLGKENNEKLWAVNVDSLCLLEKKDIEQAHDVLTSSDGVVFAQEFGEDESYNRFQIEKGFLKNIIKKDVPVSKDERRLTFSGISCFNIGKIESLDGTQSFFETVANYSKKKISVIGPFDYDIYDFGTLDLFIRSHKKIQQEISNGTTNDLLNFLNNRDILPKKFDLKSNEYLITKDYKLILKHDPSIKGTRVSLL